MKDIIKLENIYNKTILEPCSGLGCMVNPLEQADNKVITNEPFYYNGWQDFDKDFLKDYLDIKDKIDLVIMNPPFNKSLEFILKAFEYSNKIIVFEKLNFLESIKRYKYLYSKGYLKHIYIYSYRVKCHKDGKKTDDSSAVCYCWYIFTDEQTIKNPTISWIN